jgi:hypothetical protein
MRFLCVCEAGTVRSGAAAHGLKYYFGQEALTASHAKLKDDTLEMLCTWADRIVLMQPKFGDRISDQFKNKVKVLDVGQDTWGNPLDKGLMDKVLDLLQEWYFEDWKV